jgi:hypothetical protein
MLHLSATHSMYHSQLFNCHSLTQLSISCTTVNPHLAGDPLLRTWFKAEQPLVAHPPQGGLTGWRDPFLCGRPDDGEHDKWTMLIGSGHSPDSSTHARGAGCAMVYQSDSPTSGELVSGWGSADNVAVVVVQCSAAHHQFPFTRFLSSMSLRSVSLEQ